MNKSVTIVAGEGAATTLEAVIPAMEALGNFDYRTVFEDGNHGAASAVASAVEYARDSDTVIIGGTIGGGESQEGSGSGGAEDELRRAIGASTLIQPLMFHNDGPYGFLSKGPAGSTDLLLVHSLDRSVDGEEETREEIEPTVRIAFDLAHKRAYFPLIGKRFRPEESTKFQISSQERDEAGVIQPSSPVWEEVLREAEAEYQWIRQGSNMFPMAQLFHSSFDSSDNSLGLWPHDYDLWVANHAIGNELAHRGHIDPALIPSGLINQQGQGIYRPARPEGAQSAPAILLSVAMALRYSLEMPREADELDQSVKDMLTFESHGARTPEFGGEATPGEFAAAVVKWMKERHEPVDWSKFGTRRA